MGYQRSRSIGTVALATGMVMLVVFGLFQSGRTAQALTNCSVSSSAISLDSEEAQFLTLINEYRAANGRSALTVSTNLNRTSAWMAQDLGANSYFSHTDSLGRSPSTRARDCDYPSGAGENIAAGTVKDTAEEAFEMWRNSSGHNANMLNSNYLQIGIARHYDASSPYMWYWVTNFGMVDDGTNGGSSSSGSTANPTPTPTEAPAATSKAQLTSPSAGATLTGTSVTFQWSGGQGAIQYAIYAGSNANSSRYSATTTSSTSRTISNLPSDGSTVHVRLWTRFATGWQYNDYTLKAYTASSGGSGSSGGGSTVSATAAQMTSPVPGSTLPGSQMQFRWTAVQGASQYYVYFGTYTGASNWGAANAGSDTYLNVHGMPTDGRTVYIRLWTRTASGWDYNDYTYRTGNG